MNRKNFNFWVALFVSITVLYVILLTNLTLFMLKLSSSVFFQPVIHSCSGYYLKPNYFTIFTMTLGNLLAAWSFPFLVFFLMGSKSLNVSFDPSRVHDSGISRNRRVLLLGWRAFLVLANLIIYIIIFYHVKGTSIYDTYSNPFIKVISIFVQSLILFSPLIIYIILNNLLYTASLHRETDPKISLLVFLVVGIPVLLISFFLCLNFGSIDCL